MNYFASLTDFFKSPKWLMNLLLGGVCGLIPIIGPMVIMGWLVVGFWGRAEENPATFPDFEFGKFGKYIERGVWPFLIIVILSLVIVPIAFAFMIPIGVIASLFDNRHGAASGLVGAVSTLFMLFVYFGAIVVMGLLLEPFKLRASLVQDFAKSFDIAFVRRFIALMWKEILLSWLFLMFASIVLSVAGILACCVGVYFVIVPIYFAWAHLDKQMYALYLSRGGQPIPRSPKLDDAPPALPVT